MSNTTAAGKGRGAGRRRGGRGRVRPKAVAPAFIKRQIPFYEFLGEEGLVKLEQQADWIIQEIGLEFRDDPKALEIWKAGGADVKGTRVRLERGRARELCSTAPSVLNRKSPQLGSRPGMSIWAVSMLPDSTSPIRKTLP